MCKPDAVPRLTIMAKGNADIRNVLHVFHEGGRVAWNGINPVLRRRHPGWSAQVVHETLGSTEMLIAEGARPPQALADRALPLGAFPLESQFGTRLWGGGADVVVMSIQPDVMNRLCRSRHDDHLFYPFDADDWDEADRRWLAANYEPLPPLSAEESMANFATIVRRLQKAGAPAVVIFNLSSIAGWERLHSYAGLTETLSERIGQFNLALHALSRETGVSIVDVDRISARAGTDRTKLDTVTLNAEGCRLVAEELVTILDDLGCLQPLASQ